MPLNISELPETILRKIFSFAFQSVCIGDTSSFPGTESGWVLFLSQCQINRLFARLIPQIALKTFICRPHKLQHASATLKYLGAIPLDGYKPRIAYVENLYIYDQSGGGNSMINLSQLHIILQRAHALRKLTLRGSFIVNSPDICDVSLLHSPYLSYLELGHSVGPPAFYAPLKYSNVLPRLRKLNIDAMYTNSSPDYLHDLSQRVQCLESLALRDDNISGDTVAAVLAPRLHKLQTLDMHLSRVGSGCLCEAIAEHCLSLKHLTLHQLLDAAAVEQLFAGTQNGFGMSIETVSLHVIHIMLNMIPQIQRLPKLKSLRIKHPMGMAMSNEELDEFRKALPGVLIDNL